MRISLFESLMETEILTSPFIIPNKNDSEIKYLEGISIETARAPCSTTVDRYVGYFVVQLRLQRSCLSRWPPAAVRSELPRL